MSLSVKGTRSQSPGPHSPTSKQCSSVQTSSCWHGRQRMWLPTLKRPKHWELPWKLERNSTLTFKRHILYKITPHSFRHEHFCWLWWSAGLITITGGSLPEIGGLNFRIYLQLWVTIMWWRVNQEPLAVHVYSALRNDALRMRAHSRPRSVTIATLIDDRCAEYRWWSSKMCPKATSIIALALSLCKVESIPLSINANGTLSPCDGRP